MYLTSIEDRARSSISLVEVTQASVIRVVKYWTSVMILKGRYPFKMVGWVIG